MNRAFTLVEILVAILIFSIIIGAATGVFVSAIKLQRYNLTYQQLLGQTSYAVEYMSRAIRMAQKDDGTCGFSGKNYNVVGNGSIEFQTYHGQCWRFYLESDQLKLNKNGTIYNLISDDFKINNFDITVVGDMSGEQPKVTIYMEIEGKGIAPQPEVKIQTTVSQRNLNF